jgi:hypothetical protein
VSWFKERLTILQQEMLPAAVEEVDHLMALLVVEEG